MRLLAALWKGKRSGGARGSIRGPLHEAPSGWSLQCVPVRGVHIRGLLFEFLQGVPHSGSVKVFAQQLEKIYKDFVQVSCLLPQSLISCLLVRIDDVDT